ncbi:hypothetical protein QMK19_05480 [Streptomyces sp. H10-C2]|uniref:hypothetical protein n=1 Tax=unclassified Streptomyces TaxID=2593676 RepID=UPI0024BA0BC2|nr:MULTISPECIES: hypothetical protein [unclassified Streptomyces]MDJ0341489.1 hypothetical protein [Streptomyces sp. PH10-H1]MDJ0369146.1 hypothetical protein [Streptomyces sp. H10-C2]
MADPLDDRLRDLARDTEPLIVLAASADVRRRGERRRARRRVGAVAVVAAAALAVGSWVVLPRLGTGSQASPAGGSTAPDPLASGPLSGELLPPSALPWESFWKWRTVSIDLALKIPLMKCDAALYDPAAATVRSYQGNQNSNARYAIYDFGDEAAAAKGVARMADQLGKCGLIATHWDRKGGSEMSTGLRGYGSTSEGGQVSDLWLAAAGRYATVLHVVLPESTAGKLPFPDMVPVQCITRSLDRLAPSAARSDATGTQTPPAVTAPPAGSWSGSGSQPVQHPDSIFPTPYSHPTSFDRC